MINAFRKNNKIIFFMIFLLCLQYSIAFSQGLDMIEDSAVASLNDDDPVLKEFKETYGLIKSNIENKKSSQEYGVRAALLAMELKKYLIKTQAGEEILKMDSLSGELQNRITAIDNLMNLVAKRERIKQSYLSELKSLIKISATSKKINQVKPSRWKTKYLDIEIEIQPEDITVGNHE